MKLARFIGDHSRAGRGLCTSRGKAERVVHPRGDGKYAQVNERRRDTGASWSMRRGNRSVGRWGTPTRVFWEKRLQAIENKGRALTKESKEAASCWKQKGWRELQAGIVRGNTRKGTIGLKVCQ